MPPKKKESHAKRMAAQVRQHVGIEIRGGGGAVDVAEPQPSTRFGLTLPLTVLDPAPVQTTDEEAPGG